MSTSRGVVFRTPTTFGRAVDLTLAFLSLLTTFSFAVALPLVILPTLLFLTLAHQSLWAATVLVLLLSTSFVRPAQWSVVRHLFVWRLWAAWQDFELRVEYDPESITTSSLVAVVPHGVFPISLVALSCAPQSTFTPRSFRLRCGIATFLLRVPVLGAILSCFGAVDASWTSCVRELQQEKTFFFLVPGGIASIFVEGAATREKEVVLLKDRKGYAKLALQTGSPVHPCYAFGQNPTFSVWPTAGSWAHRMSKKWRISLMLFYGFWGLPVPRRQKLCLVIGAPLAVERIANPSQVDIDSLHQHFQRAVSELFERHKSSVEGYEQKKLDFA